MEMDMKEVVAVLDSNPELRELIELESQIKDKDAVMELVKKFKEEHYGK